MSFKDLECKLNDLTVSEVKAPFDAEFGSVRSKEVVNLDLTILGGSRPRLR